MKSINTVQDFRLFPWCSWGVYSCGSRTVYCCCFCVLPTALYWYSSVYRQCCIFLL